MNGPQRRRELPIMAVMLAGLLSAGVVQPAAAGATQALVLERKIPLGDVRGRIDHLAVDLARERLFVAELGNDSLGVVDLAAGNVLRRIGGLAEPQGVAYDPATDTVFVADGGDGVVHRFAGAGLAPLEPIQLDGDADNVRVDSETGEAVVGYGDGALAFIDAATGELTKQIHLPGHPESFQLERGERRMFVNVPDVDQIIVVDRPKGGEVAGWGIAGARANFPMALEETWHRLLTVYRAPAVLAVFDTASGSPMARVPACGDTDDVFFDARRQWVYLSCGAGFLDVLARDGDSYRSLAHVPTVPGARTSLFVPERDRLYLAVRARGAEDAAIWVFRPEARR